MHKSLLCFAVLVFVVAPALPAHAAATPASHGPFPESITFDGFCDGLTLYFPSLGLPDSLSSVDGYQTGCATGGVIGAAKQNTRHLTGFHRSDFIEVTVPSSGQVVYFTLGGSWVSYQLVNNQIAVANSGTWHDGTPAAADAASGSVALAAQRSTIGATGVEPDGGMNGRVAFDGYCDGMQLHDPSTGLGTRGTIDGFRTGCESEFLFGREMTLVHHVRHVWDVSFFDTITNRWLDYLVLPDHTWFAYGFSGNQIVLVNSGTWTDGNPVAGPASSV